MGARQRCPQSPGADLGKATNRAHFEVVARLAPQPTVIYDDRLEELAGWCLSVPVDEHTSIWHSTFLDTWLIMCTSSTRTTLFLAGRGRLRMSPASWWNPESVWLAGGPASQVPNLTHRRTQCPAT